MNSRLEMPICNISASSRSRRSLQCSASSTPEFTRRQALQGAAAASLVLPGLPSGANAALLPAGAAIPTAALAEGLQISRVRESMAGRAASKAFMLAHQNAITTTGSIINNPFPFSCPFPFLARS